MSDVALSSPLTTAIFNPALLRKEDLVQGFVARQDLLKILLDDMRHIQPGSPPQHKLVIGQRGLGKTTLLRRLAFAIEDDAQLSAIWMPLVFPEEQYNIKNLGDFWLNCADALSDALDRAGEKQAAEELDSKVALVPSDPKNRSSAALAVLMNETERLGRRLVLLVDNLDLVLDRLDKEEEWEFRRVISEESRLYFIGASSRALEALYEHGRAFYDFFQVHDLKGFSDDEMFALLARLAEQAGDDKVQNLIRDNPGRIRTLRVLTGGNPRTLMLLYRILSQGPEGDVQRDMEQLLDLYTPLYKARFEEMAPQSQQVVDAIAINWDPITAGDLAEKLAPLPVGQVSAQLKRLEDFGIVEKTEWFGEKKAAFQIAERFFNIWYLMRASRRVRRRLIWLVKFLEAWFEHEELSERAKAYLQRDPKAVGSGKYAEMALAYSQTVDDRFLRRNLESAGLRAALDASVRDQFDFSDLPPEVLDRKERMERLNKLKGRVLSMNLDGIDVKDFWRLLGGSPHLSLEEKTKVVDLMPLLPADNARKVYEKLQYGEKRLRLLYRERLQDIDCLYDSLATGEMADVFDMEGALAIGSQKSCRWLPGIALSCKSNPFCTPEDLSASEIERLEKSLQILRFETGYEAISAHLEGNLLSHRLKRYEDAENAYRKAINLDCQFSYPWNALGNLMRDHLGRHEEAEEAYRQAIALDPQSTNPWNGLGSLLSGFIGRYKEAEEAYRQAIALDPQSTYPWNGLGNLLSGLVGRYKEAEEAYRRAIALDPLEADPWNGLGILLGEILGRHEEAEEAYRKAIALNPHYANPWNGLGNLLTDHLGRYSEAEEAYRKAIAVDPQYASPWNGLGILLSDGLRRYNEAEEAYRRAMELDPASQYPWGNLGRLLERDQSRRKESIGAFLKAAELDPKNLRRRQKAIRVARAAEDEAPFALEGLTRLQELAPEDTELQFLKSGLLALNGDWTQAQALLEQLASREDVEPDTWAFYTAVKTGHVDELITLLEQTNANERWRPLYEALRAVQAGSAQYLRRVAPEVRIVAEAILKEIAPDLPKTAKATPVTRSRPSRNRKPIRNLDAPSNGER